MQRRYKGWRVGSAWGQDWNKYLVPFSQCDTVTRVNSLLVFPRFFVFSLHVNSATLVSIRFGWSWEALDSIWLFKMCYWERVLDWNNFLGQFHLLNLSSFIHRKCLWTLLSLQVHNTGEFSVWSTAEATGSNRKKQLYLSNEDRTLGSNFFEVLEKCMDL